MKHHEEQIQALKETGMFYYGVKKEFRGNVEKSEFFSTPGLIVNTFGYFQNDTDTWIVFVTDDERGVDVKRKKFLTEEECIKYLIELSESQNFAHYSNTVIDNFDAKKAILVEYLKKEYEYSDTKAQKAVDYLLQVKTIAFEFFYYVENGEYVPDKFASEFSGYTTKKLSAETELTVLGAFNYMVYLKKNPAEALANIKKGLPRRKIFDKNEMKEIQTTMEEKKPTQNETVEQLQQSVTENPDLQKELFTKLDALQQSFDALQQTFDDKIAEDTHKNGLFDNMHRELVNYQNGVVDKVVDTVALDIIQLVDTTKGHIRVYEKKEPTEENYKKLLRVVKGIAEDLDDILYRQNIESYRVAGHDVDVRRQKIIQTVPTDDKSKDNRIAVRVADGYEKGDKVLRPERIKIYKYEEGSEASTEK